MRVPKATYRTALIGGLISGIVALGAGWIGERISPGSVAGTLVDWSFLGLGFALPVVLLVVGAEYFRMGLGHRTAREATDAVAAAGLRMLLWFAVAGTILLVRGLLPLWLH